MQRYSRPVSAETRSRTSVLPLFRLSGSAEPKSERAAPVFVTGWRSRESLSAARRGESDMATAVQKIILSASRDIPFNKLVLSQANVRRVKAGVSIEELAEDIARRTLLQSLSVRPVLDAERPGDRHVRNPSRWPALPGARTAGQAEAPGEDRAGALRRARGRHRRGGFAGRERPARRAPSARPVPRLPGAARQGPWRRGDRRPLLRDADRGEAAAAPGRRLFDSSSTSMPRTA